MCIRDRSNIREEKGYTYGISAGIMFYPDSGLLSVSTETDNEYVEPVSYTHLNESGNVPRRGVFLDSQTLK